MVSGGKGHALALGHVENTCGHRKADSVKTGHPRRQPLVSFLSIRSAQHVHHMWTSKINISDPRGNQKNMCVTPGGKLVTKTFEKRRCDSPARTVIHHFGVLTYKALDNV